MERIALLERDTRHKFAVERARDGQIFDAAAVSPRAIPLWGSAQARVVKNRLIVQIHADEALAGVAWQARRMDLTYRQRVNTRPRAFRKFYLQGGNDHDIAI